jgi:hypothetical protein
MGALVKRHGERYGILTEQPFAHRNISTLKTIALYLPFGFCA